MRVERHETEAMQWEVARREPPAALRPLLLHDPEGWAQIRGRASEIREVPFPGIPLVLNLGPPWEVDGERRLDSFTAGMGTGPSTVRGEATWACVELRLTPQGAHRLFGIAMHELANEAVELGLLVPEARELEERLREATGWAERFDLVDAFLLRRLPAGRSGHCGVLAPPVRNPRQHGDRRPRNRARLEPPQADRPFPRRDRPRAEGGCARDAVRSRDDRAEGPDTRPRRGRLQLW